MEKIITYAPFNPLVAPDYSKMPLSQLAGEISKDWRKQGKGINFGAKPYLEAMFCLDKVTDNYGCDSGRSIVAYFLSNANTWKGEVAKAIKKELNKRIK
jgi:hypothetical protein